MLQLLDDTLSHGHVVVWSAFDGSDADSFIGLGDGHRQPTHPGKVPLLNEIDVFCSLCTLLLLLVGSPLPMTHLEAERLQTVAASYAVILMVCFTCGAALLTFAVAASFALGFLGVGELDPNCLLNFRHGVNPEELRMKAQLVAAELSQLGNLALLEEIKAMNPYDLSRIDRSMNFLARELFPTLALIDSIATTGISSRPYQRTSTTSMLPALEPLQSLQPVPEEGPNFFSQDQHVEGPAASMILSAATSARALIRAFSHSTRSRSSNSKSLEDAVPSVRSHGDEEPEEGELEHQMAGPCEVVSTDL